MPNHRDQQAIDAQWAEFNNLIDPGRAIMRSIVDYLQEQQIFTEYEFLSNTYLG